MLGGDIIQLELTFQSHVNVTYNDDSDGYEIDGKYQITHLSYVSYNPYAASENTYDDDDMVEYDWSDMMITDFHDETGVMYVNVTSAPGYIPRFLTLYSRFLSLSLYGCKRV